MIFYINLYMYLYLYKQTSLVSHCFILECMVGYYGFNWLDHVTDVYQIDVIVSMVSVQICPVVNLDDSQDNRSVI